jgi:hypothetical protein
METKEAKKKLTKAELIQALEDKVNVWKRHNDVVKRGEDNMTHFELGVLAGMEIMIKTIKGIINQSK